MASTGSRALRFGTLGSLGASCVLALAMLLAKRSLPPAPAAVGDRVRGEPSAAMRVGSQPHLPAKLAVATPEPAVRPAAAAPTMPPELITVEIVERGQILGAWIPPAVVVRDPQLSPIPAKVSYVAGSASVPNLPRRDLDWQLVRLTLPRRTIWRMLQIAGDLDRFELRVGVPMSVRGVVVDAAGRPLPGAWLWLGGRETKTESDGKFVVDDLLSGPYVPLVARAQGKADHWQPIDAELGMEPVRVVMEDAGAPTFESDMPKADRRAFLVRDSSITEATSAVEHYPFFLPAIVDEPWPTIRGGQIELTGLPRGVALQVVHHFDTGGTVVTEVPADDRDRLHPALVDLLGRPHDEGACPRAEW